MDPSIRTALAITPASNARARTVDITTTGAKSGRPRRIEIWFYRVDGVIYLTTQPAKRDWYANIVANPEFTFHIAGADLAARGIPVTDAEAKRRVLGPIVDDLNQPSNPARIPQPVQPLDEWVAGSPLVRVEFADD
jgi:deazaflavin-dependent oxidoreductase (nitroreductase family)